LLRYTPLVLIASAGFCSHSFWYACGLRNGCTPAAAQREFLRFAVTFVQYARLLALHALLHAHCVLLLSSFGMLCTGYAGVNEQSAAACFHLRMQLDDCMLFYVAPPSLYPFPLCSLPRLHLHCCTLPVQLIRVFDV
jgi:hypothetical protein